MIDTILNIQDISMIIDETIILSNCNLKLKKGEILGLIGPSGCGKTTLLKIACGLIQPTEGEIVLEGEIQRWTKNPFPNVTYLFQSPVLFPHLNVIENVMLGVDKNLTKKLQFDTAMNSLEFTNIGDLAERNVNNLSGGEAQRVAFARAHAQKNDLMLLDEPFASVDQEQKMNLALEFKQWIKSLKKSAIFVTHDEHEVYAVSDRILRWNEIQKSQ
ncbi:MAG: ATP-binding cassette domain-containing protein [Candidatus Poseidoniales archaeon]